jgi:hypothetical protein
MFVRVFVDEIACDRPTETDPFNDRDEIYLTAAGSSSHTQIEIPRIAPPPPEDYYGLQAGQRARNIQVWQGFMGDGEYAYLTIAGRDQDNAQLPAILATVKAAALGIAAIFVDTSLGPTALDALKDAGAAFVRSLSTDGDQTIGAFSLRVQNRGQVPSVDWIATADMIIAWQNGTAAVFEATGSNARYTLRLSVQRPQLPMIVNRQTGKCLDVVGGSNADGANVQQFHMHGGGNQRWLLKPLGVAPALPVSLMPWPYYAIIADHSGKCLDVVDGSTADQANVQQYNPHYGANQSWILVPSGDDFVIVNLHSGKCLDVAGASSADGANVQQFRYHGGLNQRWRLQL